MRLIAVAVLVVMVCAVAQADLPKTLEEFQKQIAEKASDPKAATKLWFDALHVYLGGNKDLGKQLITEMMRYKDWYVPTKPFVMALEKKPYIFRSYAKGATPENQYKMDPNKYELVFHGDINRKPYVDRDEDQFVKLFVRSGGADLPRPITLQRNKRGEYKVYEYSSIYLGIRPPKVAVVFGESIPETVDPVWTFKHWLQGILLYLSGEEEDGLTQMFALMKAPDPKLRTFKGRLNAQYSHIWRSYVTGTTPENGYLVPDINDFEIATYFQPDEAPTETSTRIRMFVRSSGADSARPMRLERDDKGEWRMSEYSSLCVGIRKPVEAAIYGESVPESTDPVWVVKEWLHGILLYLSGEEDRGFALMNSLMKEPTDRKFRSFHLTMSEEKAYIWRSYVTGATAANQYNVPDVNDFAIATYYQPDEAPTETSKRIRMFVRSSGADSARPVGLDRDDRGEWRMSEYSSLCVGVRPPVDPNADDF